MKLLLLFITILLFSISLYWCESNNDNQPTTWTEQTNQFEFNSLQQKENETSPEYIDIKYRNSNVDVSTFEDFPAPWSSFVQKAWYDEDNQYMIINLNQINYHYCEVPRNIWTNFKNADSHWRYYNRYIKWNYDCRYNHTPAY